MVLFLFCAGCGAAAGVPPRQAGEEPLAPREEAVRFEEVWAVPAGGDRGRLAGYVRTYRTRASGGGIVPLHRFYDSGWAQAGYLAGRGETYRFRHDPLLAQEVHERIGSLSLEDAARRLLEIGGDEEVSFRLVVARSGR